MSQARKRCPICDTSNPHKAAYCNNCGAALADVDVELEGAPGPRGRSSQYDFRYGETDLVEDGLRGKARAYLTGIILLIALAGAAVGVFVVYPSTRPEPTATPTLDPNSIVQASATVRPTVLLATVTRGSPTLTLTPTPSLTPTLTETFTPEPCIQQVLPNDGMIALVSRCGHVHLDVIPLVVTINGLNNENDLRSGQFINIPFPTPTEDPNAGLPTQSGDRGVETVSLGAAGGLSQEDIRATQVVDPFFRPTATNPPGVQNYTVVFGDTLISVIAQFNTNINAIDMLNPDLTFSQCEMGTTFGGNTCSVALSEGQILRVPAPTPTPTLSPTSNGSETPTPTATATFNAPNALSPSGRAYFRRDEAVTLRWSATGILAEGETYRITVQDLTRGREFTFETTDLYFIVPPEWQGEFAQQYEYAWSVAVAQSGSNGASAYSTLPLTFSWEGRGEK